MPLSAPDEPLKVAHDGLFCTENVSVLPSGSLAVGRNEYAEPTVAVTTGVPDMVGGRFVATVPDATVMENDGSDAYSSPSVTPMLMRDVVPAFAVVGVPVSAPVLELKPAQAGLLEMKNRNVRLRGSVAVGVKEYACPTVAVVAGVPEIVGRRRRACEDQSVVLRVPATEVSLASAQTVTAKAKATTNVKRCDVRAIESNRCMCCPGDVLITMRDLELARE